MPGIIVDIGTGDGSFAYQVAKENPNRLIIGIDPNQKTLVKPSLKAVKKGHKGGLENAMFVLGRIEDLPRELDGIVNQVFINFPWAGLLRKLVTADPAVWSNVRRICQRGAWVDLLLGYEQTEGKEAGLQELPGFNEVYIRDQMAPKLLVQNFNIISKTEIEGADLKHYPSTWAKKLAYGKARQFYHLHLQAI